MEVRAFSKSPEGDIFIRSNLKSIFTSVLLSLGLFVLAYTGEEAKKYGRYEVFMYKNEEVNNPTSVFSPSDKIFIQIKFFGLKGDCILDTYWYNPSGKLQETTSHRFILHEKSSYTAWSWLALKKMGHLSRILSATEYSIEFYGRWRVEAYLNGERIVTKYFEAL